MTNGQQIIPASPGWQLVRYDGEELYRDEVIGWYAAMDAWKGHDVPIVTMLPITINGLADDENWVLQNPAGGFCIPLYDEFKDETEVLAYFHGQSTE